MTMAGPIPHPTPHKLPEFDSVEDERLHRKQRLAATFRLFGKFGFNEGVAGHVTARDPEHNELFWVNPFGLSFDLIRVSDLICVDHNGAVVEGDWPVNQAAFCIHSQIHQARPDALVVVAYGEILPAEVVVAPRDVEVVGSVVLPRNPMGRVEQVGCEQVRAVEGEDRRVAQRPREVAVLRPDRAHRVLGGRPAVLAG
jgi:hypothetical protein